MNSKSCGFILYESSFLPSFFYNAEPFFFDLLKMCFITSLCELDLDLTKLLMGSKKQIFLFAIVRSAFLAVLKDASKGRSNRMIIVHLCYLLGSLVKKK